MVRPERRVDLAGESPVRVSAGAPGSRLQPGGEIRPCRAECQKPLQQRGANRRAATISERNSLVTLSAERCFRGPSRSCHGEGNRQHSRTGRDAGPLRGHRRRHVGTDRRGTGEALPGGHVGQRPAYKAGWPKSRGAGRESERLVVPVKACNITRWREGALL